MRLIKNTPPLTDLNDVFITDKGIQPNQHNLIHVLTSRASGTLQPDTRPVFGGN